MNQARCAILVALTIASTAQAQEPTEAWDWKVAPYLWMLNGDGSTNIGPLEGDVDFDFGDVLDNLEFAAELFVAADRGHHGIHGDFQYLELEPDPQTAPIGPGQVQTKIELTTVEGAYKYHFSGTPMGSSLLVGARYLDTTVTLTPTLVPGARTSVDWADGFVGYQYVATLTDRWNSQFQVTAGAGGSDLTLTAQLLFTRATNGGNHWAVGARIWDIDYEETLPNNLPFELDLTMYGLIGGFVFD